MCQPFKPRIYTISSSEVMFPNMIHMTVRLVEEEITRTRRTKKGFWVPFNITHFGAISRQIKSIYLNRNYNLKAS